MKNLLKNSNFSTGRVSLPQCDNRPQRDNRNALHVTRTPLRTYALAFFLLLFLLPFGARAQYTINWSGTVTLNSGQIIESNYFILLQGNTIVNVPSGTATVHAQITGNYTLTKIGDGTLVFTSPQNHYTGPTTINKGTLQIGDGTYGQVWWDITVNNEAMLYLSYSGTCSKVISGSGMVVKTGSGKLTLTGANTYTGLTYIHDGTHSCSEDCNCLIISLYSSIIVF